MKLRAPHEQARLARLVERIVNKEHRLRERGLRLFVQQIEVCGRVPQRIRAWATLHFTLHGSPYCCGEPSCLLFVEPGTINPVEVELRKSLGLRQSVAFDFARVVPVIHRGVLFDGICGGTFVPADVNETDPRGRTALWRAVARGYDDQVEELLERGADPSIPGPDGRTVFDLVDADREKAVMIGYLLKSAEKRKR
jgi:hypothetical protein